MSETSQKLAFTHPIVVLKSGLKNNWMKKLDRVNRPLEPANFELSELYHRDVQSLNRLAQLNFGA